MHLLIIPALALTVFCTACTQQPSIQSSTEIPLAPFQVVGRSPEGTQSGDVDSNKILHMPFSQFLLGFNKPLDPSTITIDHIYALAGIDEKIPVSYQYDPEDSTVNVSLREPIEPTGELRRFTIVIKGVRSADGDAIDELIYNIDLQK